jgi:putative redox protein
MAFDAEVDGHTVTLDAAEAVGGKNRGPTPKPMLLVSLAGCTGMDVIAILNKMQQPYSYFDVKVEGELTDEHPKQYHSIKIVYEFKKDDGLDESKVEKAVQLSQDRYCGVSALLKKGSELDYEIRYI